MCVCIVYQREKKTEENKESDFFVKFGFLLGRAARREISLPNCLKVVFNLSVPEYILTF